MITGFNVRCDVGPVEVLRAPFLEIVYRRRAVLTRAVIQIPDSEGKVRAAVAQGDPMHLRFGYRGETTLWHEWRGTVASIDQPPRRDSGRDAVVVRGVGLEKALSETRVTESFTNESAAAVAFRLLAKTGLPVAGADLPGDTLPHQVFSGVTVARALKQLEVTLSRQFGRDLSRYAVWLGKDGLRWSADDEPGDVYVVETAKNLLNHTPPARPGEMGVVLSAPLPGLTHSMKVGIRDARRGIAALVRAEEVRHVLSESRGNSTAVLYGKEAGWG